MISIINLFRTLIAKLLVIIMTITSSFLAGSVTKNTDLPTTPDDFTPVFRFAGCSDVHVKTEGGENESARFAKLIDFMNEYSASQDYTGFDALCVAGDFTDTGLDLEYDIFNSILDAHLSDSTDLVISAGNHEYIAYRSVDASAGARMFEEKLGEKLDDHIVINGYHFITVSYDDNGRTFSGKKSWLNNELKSATIETDKPIIVIQHPAPFGTIYGSINWSDFDTATVLTKYPQVVNFSGHSHYPINDPRSIWQGSYTALGCGTLSYFETELDGFAGQFPYDYRQAAQFYIVEGDKDGNLRIMPYDLITDQFFANEYYLTGLANKNFDYAYSTMKARDTAPTWNENHNIETYKNDDGETILRFDGANARFVVESYKVSMTLGPIPVFSDNFSGKYMYLFEEDVYECNLGKLREGAKYSVQIVALSAYANTSNSLIYEFTA